VERHRAPLSTAALSAVPILFVAIFFAYPVVSITARGFRGNSLVDLFESASFWSILRFTTAQAALSTVATLMAGIPAAWALARVDFRGRRAVRALLTVPFVLPTVVVGTAFLALLGDRGPLDGLQLENTFLAIVLAHAFFNVAVIVRVVGELWARLDPTQSAAARMLGASPWRAFTATTLPALAPAIAAASAIVFLFSFTSFGIVLILGGPTRSTLETEIYRQTAQLLNLDVAAALTIVQLACVLALLVVTGRTQRRYTRSLRLQPAHPSARSARSPHHRLALTAALTPALVLVVSPLLALVVRSVRRADGTMTLDGYRALGGVERGALTLADPLEAARTSIGYAIVATVIAMVVGGIAAFVIGTRPSRATRLVDGWLALPLGVSAVTIGFGFLITFDHPPLDLRASTLLIGLAQALVALPLVVRLVEPTLSAVDPHVREAAAMLGAAPGRVRREIDLPIARRALLAAAGFAAAVSLGEFGATAFIARPGRPTLPVAIYRLLGQPGAASAGAAMAASVLLASMVFVVMLVTDAPRETF
jgi:thiamine transport system permease protein